MTPKEIGLFTNFLRCADSYLEFGTGGSTLLAASLVRTSTTSVDSSLDWLDKVALACSARNVAIQPLLVHADIGPIGEWGAPAGETARDRWPNYHRSIWTVAGADRADLYMIDGRFRVACFMQTLLRCPRDAVILMHDFASRSRYHIVREVARQIAGAELAAFVPRFGVDQARIRDILDLHTLQAA